MLQIFFGVLILGVILFLIRNKYQRIEKKGLEKIQSTWGIPKNELFDFDKIEGYFIHNPEDNFHTLSNQTKSDIDFYELFSFIDRTTSKVGQQYLFDKLNKPTNNIPELIQLNEQANFFTVHKKDCENTQMLLLTLGNDGSYSISSLMFKKFPQRPQWFSLIVLDIALTVFLLILAPFFPILLIWLIIPLAINLGIHFWNKNNIFSFIKSIPQLNKLIKVCEKLSKQKLPFDNNNISQSIHNLRTFQSKTSLLNLGGNPVLGELEQILYYFFELVKAFFLIDFFTFYSLLKELQNKQEDINHLFKFAGSIDTAISIASLRYGSTNTCQPVFLTNSKNLNAVKLYHPLISNCVENDISVKGKSILITGSNMSGKTTFLRIVGINAILAQTIYTCFAEKYEAPIIKLFSSIRIDDSLLEGKSYYFEEVNVMAILIKETKSGSQNIFLLDEVFKGTNTIERIASAKAILSYLNKGDNIVFVSTHDIELSDLLSKEYELYHFVETITNNQLHFDHQLKFGQLKTRNAIKILEMSEYPSEIVEEAKNISKILSTSNIDTRYTTSLKDITS